MKSSKRQNTHHVTSKALGQKPLPSLRAPRQKKKWEKINFRDITLLSLFHLFKFRSETIWPLINKSGTQSKATTLKMGLMINYDKNKIYWNW